MKGKPYINEEINTGYQYGKYGNDKEWVAYQPEINLEQCHEKQVGNNEAA